MGEVALFTAANEAFGVAFEFVPDVTNGRGFFFGDGVVESGVADGGEEVGELLDDFLGGGHDLEAFATVAGGIFDEDAAAFEAEPLEDVIFLGEFVELEDAVQGIRGAAAGFVIGLGPFVDEGKRDAEFGGDFFRVALGERLTDDFVGFHDAVLVR